MVTNQKPAIFIDLTVVRIHISAPTLAPMATAPAVPPRIALAEALAMISLKVGGSVLAASLVDDMVSIENLGGLVFLEN